MWRRFRPPRQYKQLFQAVGRPALQLSLIGAIREKLSQSGTTPAYITSNSDPENNWLHIDVAMDLASRQKVAGISSPKRVSQINSVERFSLACLESNLHHVRRGLIQGRKRRPTAKRLACLVAG